METNIDTQNIPVELREIPNWVLWKSEEVPGRDKPTKVPYQTNGHKARANDSNTWTTFDNVMSTLRNDEGMNNSFSGIGFVFSDGHPFIGIDIDDCINDGVISEGAMKIINAFNSYTEMSVSGKGLHTIVKIDRNRVVRSKSYEKFFGTDFKECEIAYGNKYFTMTGTVIDDLYTVVDATHTLLRFIPGNRQRADAANETAAEQETTFDKELLSKVVQSLGELNKHRKDDYHSWIEVGMSLRSLENVGLALWDNWSKGSSKYVPGECYKKWQTFNTGDDRLTLNSLFYWAEQDSKEVIIPEGNRKSKPSSYKHALEMMGYTFSLNLMDSSVYQTGYRIDDVFEAKVKNRMREHNYLKDKWVTDSILELADRNAFHPIREYLSSLVWDGEDTISRLCSYFKDKEGVFHLYMRKWSIGAVARAYSDNGVQIGMLVLDGKQNLGKSFFALWLGSPLPAYFIESAIYPEDKDYKIRCISSWIWEVHELGSTTRKADREALKAFISERNITVRKPYGHHDIRKPATTNFIGTLNNEGGFLNDPTGSRRFMVVTLEEIDWNYSKEVDINQVWAQARALYLADERWELTREELEKQEKINEGYRVYNPLVDCIRKEFIVDTDSDNFIPSSVIMERLFENKYIQRMDKIDSMKVSEALIELGCVQERRYVNGAQCRGWKGIGFPTVGGYLELAGDNRNYK
jgi:Virulence-associated protein E-like domain/Primase C terminal 2 (PriCT-2)